MTNPMINPQPNYSGVTIQISNPAVNVGDCARNCAYGNNIPQVAFVQPAIGVNGNRQLYGYNAENQISKLPQNNYVSYPQGSYANGTDAALPIDNPNNGQINDAGQFGMTNPVSGYPNAYPAQYYLNNYNYSVNGNGNDVNGSGLNNGKGANISDSAKNGFENDISNAYSYSAENDMQNIKDSDSSNRAYPYALNNQKDAYNMADNNYPPVNSYKVYADDENKQGDTDFTRSTNIIEDIDERVAEKAKEKKNTKEKRIVALTDEYIKSLENYLNNPNDEIRLMASKEVLKRLDEDKDRYNDAALNALLNKMMQDPSKLVRLASLSAFASQLACGNDYTVQLLHNIQSNPNADKEDVLQAADILLKMSADVEVKNVPIPPEKDAKKIKNIKDNK